MRQDLPVAPISAGGDAPAARAGGWLVVELPDHQPAGNTTNVMIATAYEPETYWSPGDVLLTIGGWSPPGRAGQQH